MASGANTASVTELVHVVGSTTQIISVGTIAMNGDQEFELTEELAVDDFQLADPLTEVFAEIGADDGSAGWEFPSECPHMSDDDNTFAFIPESSLADASLGPSQPLPKSRPQHVGPRPRVAPYRTLHLGAPVVRSTQTSMSSHSANLRVSDLISQSCTDTIPQTCPRSIVWHSVDDLEFQQLPPQGRATPISLQVMANRPTADHQESLKVRALDGKPSSDDFRPPQHHTQGSNPTSATTLVRTKQPSSNPVIVQMFRNLLSIFGADSSLGTQLTDSSFRDIHLNRVIDGYAASTLMKYMSGVGNFIRTCTALGQSFVDISELQLADVLITVQLSKSSDTSGCSSTGSLKALRWWQKVAGVVKWKNILFAPMIQSFLTTKLPMDRAESVPIPLWCIIQWEKRLLTSSCPEHMILILGFLLVLIWGSLRFSDAQRTDLRSLVYNGENLRGLSWRTKTTNRGQAFGVLAQGLLSKRSFHWMHRYLSTLDALLDRVGAEDIDYLMPDVMDQTGVVLPLQPMSYATAVKWLRYCVRAPWKQQPGSRLDPSMFTIHSCKATVLSWSAQQAHLLTEEARLQQGHHRIGSKGPLRLYSRDDVYPALRLQGILRESILQGWRPMVPQHRGSQSALVEPTVGVIEQYSKVGLMSFKWFRFCEPPEPEDQPVQPEVENLEESSESSSSDSSDSSSSSPKKKTQANKTTPKTLASYSQVCCGVTHFGVGHAMIPDESPTDSSLFWQDISWKTACGRRLSKTTQMMNVSQSNQVQAFCNHPGCRRAWNSIHQA